MWDCDGDMSVTFGPEGGRVRDCDGDTWVTAQGYAYPKIEYVKIHTYLSKNTIRVWYVPYTKVLFMVYSETHSLRII